jgi:hypothetical protein
VTSAYGYTIGTGWYDANSTAVVKVIRGETAGRQFDGWIGSVTSNSQAVEVRMDSSKEMTATWGPTTSPSQGAYNVANVAGFVLAIIFSIAVALIVRYKTSKRS